MLIQITPKFTDSPALKREELTCINTFCTIYFQHNEKFNDLIMLLDAYAQQTEKSSAIKIIADNAKSSIEFLVLLLDKEFKKECDRLNIGVSIESM